MCTRTVPSGVADSASQLQNSGLGLTIEICPKEELKLADENKWYLNIDPIHQSRFLLWASSDQIPQEHLMGQDKPVPLEEIRMERL